MKDFVPTDALSASFFMRLFNKELEVNLRCDHVGEHHSQSKDNLLQVELFRVHGLGREINIVLRLGFNE